MPKSGAGKNAVDHCPLFSVLFPRRASFCPQRIQIKNCSFDGTPPDASTLLSAPFFEQKDAQVVQRHNHFLARIQSFNCLVGDINPREHSEDVMHVCKNPVRFSDELLYEKELHLLLQIQSIRLPGSRFNSYFRYGFMDERTEPLHSSLILLENCCSYVLKSLPSFWTALDILFLEMQPINLLVFPLAARKYHPRPA